MDELHAILNACRSLAGTSRDAVLATVVHVTGSAYRRPGARMLILPDGRQIGSISGGCLEGEIVKKAWWFTDSNRAVVRVYDTTSDEDAVWEFGLGCNGVVHVLLERVHNPSAFEMMTFLEAHHTAKTPAVVATVIRAGEASNFGVGHRWLVDDASLRQTNLGATAVERFVLTHAASALADKKSCLVHLDTMDVFVEWIGPPLSLCVFGAGHDAIPLVAIAAQLGWTITVADGRPAYAKPERFPGADRVVVMTQEDPLRHLPIDSDSAVVMMTHNFPMDVHLMPVVLAMRPKYLGLLGPKPRAEKLFREIRLPIPQSVHAPAGLDIGCNTPSAIALSITSEIQAALSGRKGGMLRLRGDAIHSPAAEIGTPAIADSAGSTRPSYCDTIVGSNV